MKQDKRITIFFVLATLSAVLFTTTPAFAWTVPGTGVTRCFNDTIEISCPQPGEDFFGQDGNYQKYSHDFKDNLDDTVIDLNTGLQWQKSIYNPSSSWDVAHSICANAVYGGHSDWRLPTPIELLHIVNYKNSALVNEFFNITGDSYWTDTTPATHSSASFEVEFDVKEHSWTDKSNNNYTRCVRGNKLTQNIKDNNNGTLTDTSSHLMWEKARTGPMNWKNALSYCENLKTAGHDDWMLPNVYELNTLSDYTKSYPALNPVVSELSGNYWTRTPVIPDYVVSYNYAFIVDFDLGMVDYYAWKTSNNYVRCVRRSDTPSPSSSSISASLLLLLK